MTVSGASDQVGQKGRGQWGKILDRIRFGVLYSTQPLGLKCVSYSGRNVDAGVQYKYGHCCPPIIVSMMVL
jgi:hypothetical protein